MESVETYNLINYLKIIDLSLLNLFDYVDYQNDLYVDSDEKMVLNFNGKAKEILESLLIRNINNAAFYGKENIIVNTCIPKDNWRTIEQIVQKVGQKYIVTDESIYIDNIKMNMFFDNFFKRAENSNNFFNRKSNSIMLSSNIKFISFKSIDIYDAFRMINNILSNFGYIRKDDFNYNLIKDGNNVFMHGTSFVSELLDEVRLMLINKGVI